MEQIEQYLRFFSKESFLFLLMEDLIQKPVETLDKILSFINVERGIDSIKEAPIAANKSSDHPEWFVRQQLTASLKAIPGVAHTAVLLPKGVKDSAYQVLKKLKYKEWLEKQYLPPPMLPKTRQMLLEKFRNPNQRLAEFLNRDLSHWDK